MRRLLFIFSFLSLLVVDGKAQEVETLTLEDCLRIGIDNNLSLEGKRKEIQKSKYGVSENRSKLLPQITVIAGYNYENIAAYCQCGVGNANAAFQPDTLYLYVHS